MAEEALVESMVSESIKFLQELDKRGAGPSNALWYFFSDAEEWRLLVAGTAFDALLPRDEGLAYQKVAAAISAAGLATLSIADVKVVRTDYALLQATAFLVRTPATGVVRAHFRDSTFNGIFVKEMLVLRAA